MLFWGEGLERGTFFVVDRKHEKIKMVIESEVDGLNINSSSHNSWKWEIDEHGALEDQFSLQGGPFSISMITGER